MTKKDYQLIAKVIKTTFNIWLEAKSKWQKSNHADRGEKVDGINKILASIDVIVQGLSFELKKDNPKFEEVKFRIACGVAEIKDNKVYPIK